MKMERPAPGKTEAHETFQSTLSNIKRLEDQLADAPEGATGREEGRNAMHLVHQAMETPMMTAGLPAYAQLHADMRTSLIGLLMLPENADCVRMGLDAHVLFERYRKHNLAGFEPVIEESEWRRPELQESVHRCVMLLSAPREL